MNWVYLTLVFGNVEGDARFDMKFDPKLWRTKEEDDIPQGEHVSFHRGSLFMSDESGDIAKNS